MKSRFLLIITAAVAAIVPGFAFGMEVPHKSTITCKVEIMKGDVLNLAQKTIDKILEGYKDAHTCKLETLNIPYEKDNDKLLPVRITFIKDNKRTDLWSNENKHDLITYLPLSLLKDESKTKHVIQNLIRMNEDISLELPQNLEHRPSLPPKKQATVHTIEDFSKKIQEAWIRIMKPMEEEANLRVKEIEQRIAMNSETLKNMKETTQKQDPKIPVSYLAWFFSTSNELWMPLFIGSTIFISLYFLRRTQAIHADMIVNIAKKILGKPTA